MNGLRPSRARTVRPYNNRPSSQLLRKQQGTHLGSLSGFNAVLQVDKLAMISCCRHVKFERGLLRLDVVRRELALNAQL